MSDPFNPTISGQRQDNSTDAKLRQPAEDLRAAAREAKQAAGETASTFKSEARATAESLKNEGAALLDNARTRAEELAEEGTRAGVDRVDGIARAIHRAADELDQDSPQLARIIHDAAGSVDGITRALREKSPGDMFRSVEDFARRQPLAFFGAAALAGFALARFARSSSSSGQMAGYDRDVSNMRPMTDSGYSQATSYGTPASGTGYAQAMGGGTPSAGMGVGGTTGETATGAPGWVADEDGTARPATLASASLGGAAAYRSDDTMPKPRGGSENG